VMLNITGSGTLIANGGHGYGVAGGSHHRAWGPITVTRTAAGTFQIRLHPNLAARRMIQRDRRSGSSLHVRVKLTFTSSAGVKQTRWITVRLLKARKH
jgi:hypothetical protein